jgi:hypothetical protein
MSVTMKKPIENNDPQPDPNSDTNPDPNADPNPDPNPDPDSIDEIKNQSAKVSFIDPIEIPPNSDTEKKWGEDPAKELSEYLAECDYNKFISDIVTYHIGDEYDVPPVVIIPQIVPVEGSVKEGVKDGGLKGGKS